jgi:DNA-binding CsgD family transcriptional regulator
VAAQLIVVDPDEGYEFRHALVREAVHDDLLPGEHARLHARYAAAIEADAGLVGSGRAPAAIAHHWLAAHDHPRALTAAVRAAAAAGKRYAYAEKSGLLERVLELWEQVPDAAERSRMAHLDVLEAALSATVAAGDYARGLLLTKAALAEVDREAEPLRAARLLERRAKLLRTLGKSDGAAENREAYRLAGRVGDPAQRATLLADIADSLARVDPAEGSRVAQEAVTAARDLGDLAAQVSATITHGRLCNQQLPPEDGLVELRRAARTAQDTGNGPGLVRALVNISDLLYETGDYTEAAAAAERGIAEAHRFGISRSNGAFLFSNRAEALLALGRWDEAEALCAESARLDPPGTLAVPWLLLQSRLRLARGHPGAADALQRALGFLGRPYLEPQFRLPLLELRVIAALEAGDAAGAAGAAAAAVADPALPGQPRWGWPLLAAAARAGTVTGDHEIRDRVRRAAGALPPRYPAERAYAAATAAELAGAGAELPAWEAAVVAWRADGQPYQLGLALLRLAEAAAAAGDRAAAADAVIEARTAATELAATPLRDRADTLARRLGLRGPDGPPGAALALTARELEVLRLVAAGHSNRRIAEQLFITAKTASVHVSRIIAKLAVTNRLEAAAVAHRLGLLADDGRPGVDQGVGDPTRRETRQPTP